MLSVCVLLLCTETVAFPAGHLGFGSSPVGPQAASRPKAAPAYSKSLRAPGPASSPLATAGSGAQAGSSEVAGGGAPGSARSTIAGCALGPGPSVSLSVLSLRSHAVMCCVCVKKCPFPWLAHARISLPPAALLTDYVHSPPPSPIPVGAAHVIPCPRGSSLILLGPVHHLPCFACILSVLQPVPLVLWWQAAVCCMWLELACATPTTTSSPPSYCFPPLHPPTHPHPCAQVRGWRAHASAPRGTAGAARHHLP